MAARLTTIAGEIGTLIDAMTTTGGYNYNWPAVNEVDAARMGTFPNAIVRYKTTEASGGVAGLYGMQDAEFVIEVHYKITPSTTTKPEFTANAALDNALADLIRLFSLNVTGYLPLSQEAVLSFKSSEKVDNNNQSTYMPTKLVTRWNCFYHSS
jgi:hypothetical protein